MGSPSGPPARWDMERAEERSNEESESRQHEETRTGGKGGMKREGQTLLARLVSPFRAFAFL